MELVFKKIRLALRMNEISLVGIHLLRAEKSQKTLKRKRKSLKKFSLFFHFFFSYRIITENIYLCSKFFDACLGNINNNKE